MQTSSPPRTEIKENPNGKSSISPGSSKSVRWVMLEGFLEKVSFEWKKKRVEKWTVTVVKR